MENVVFTRDAVDADAETLCEVEREVATRCPGSLVSLPDELHLAPVRARIANASRGVGKYIVVESGGQIVGHASLYPMERKQLSHVLRLDLCVRLGHWNKGYGRALMNHLLAWAQSTPQYHKIELLVRSTNAPAVRLYRSLGFIDEGRHRDRLRLQGGRCVDDIAMALLLTRDQA